MEMQPHILLKKLAWQIKMLRSIEEAPVRKSHQRTLELWIYAILPCMLLLVELNMEAQSSDVASQLIPQLNYKLDVNALNSCHPGEKEDSSTSRKVPTRRQSGFWLYSKGIQGIFYPPLALSSKEGRFLYFQESSYKKTKPTRRQSGFWLHS
uniref:Uncharacterized protein n=1 Tax=Salix viminalis TaxID=40686 RepID=A0A6N2N6M2_SALVM